MIFALTYQEIESTKKEHSLTIKVIKKKIYSTE